MTDTVVQNDVIGIDDVLDIEGAACFLKCGMSTLYHYVSQKKFRVSRSVRELYSSDQNF